MSIKSTRTTNNSTRQVERYSKRKNGGDEPKLPSKGSIGRKVIETDMPRMDNDRPRKLHVTKGWRD